MTRSHVLPHYRTLLLVVVLCLGLRYHCLEGKVVTSDRLGDAALEDIDGIIQETEGITVEEYNDDGNMPVNPHPSTGDEHDLKAIKRNKLYRSAQSPVGSLHTLAVDPKGLSLTSFLYNPTATYSPWVQRHFGQKAVYHNRSSGNSALQRDPLTLGEIRSRQELFRRAFTLPDDAVQPLCSIEMLGYGLLDVDFPLKENVKHGQTPSVGKASLDIDKINTTWPCVYRAVYENWRFETEYTKPNYWSLLFYCYPPQQSVSCDNLRMLVDSRRSLTTRMKGSIEAKMTMHLRKIHWTQRFTAFLVLPTRDPGFTPQLTPPQGVTNIMRGMDTSRHYVNSPTSNVAVCLVVPYTTTDPDKMLANGAMIYEWVRYHAKLGMRVIMYDRDKANWQYIFNSSYAASLGLAKKLELDYHGYTMRGLLDPSRAGFHYDNTEADVDLKGPALKDRKNRYENQGHDKVLTLTHCRFEAKAVYNIDTVLVVDFDEFLYCPIAHAAPRAQATFFHNFVQYHHGRGVEQVMLPQRLVSNTTASTRDCIVEKVKSNKTFFSCFAPFEFYMGGHSVKSLHIGHVCPLTGYHQACPTLDAPRSYDCICDNHQTRQNPWRPFQKNIRNRECAVIHLSTNKNNYKKYRFKPNEVDKMRSEPMELYKVLFYHDPEEAVAREKRQTEARTEARMAVEVKRRGGAEGLKVAADKAKAKVSTDKGAVNKPPAQSAQPRSTQAVPKVFKGSL